MFDSIASSLKKYVDFHGRATRKEYWIFVLFIYVAATLAGLVDRLMGTESVGNLLMLGLLLPYFSVTARRMHDVGKSGWFMLIPIYNFILTVTPSVATSNSSEL